MARAWEGVVSCSERVFPVGRKTGGLSRCVGPVAGMGAEIEAKQSVCDSEEDFLRFAILRLKILFTGISKILLRIPFWNYALLSSC